MRLAARSPATNRVYSLSPILLCAFFCHPPDLFVINQPPHVVLLPVDGVLVEFIRRITRCFFVLDLRVRVIRYTQEPVVGLDVCGVGTCPLLITGQRVSQKRIA